MKPAEASVENADIILGNVPPAMLKNAPNLRWIQLNTAGTDGYPEVLREGCLLTNATGAYGLAISEHMLAMLLELMKKLKAQYQTAMVMITHDLGIVAEICDYVAIMYAGEVVEYGTREHIFNSTAHPYTKGLFACIPDIFTEQNELVPINGLTPDPTDLPQGCRFNPRCPYATERCRQEHPENVEIEPGHFVACHLINGGGNENA